MTMIYINITLFVIVEKIGRNLNVQQQVKGLRNILWTHNHYYDNITEPSYRVFLN